MNHIKTVKVTNPKNAVVQVPGFISFVKWGLRKGDELEVFENDDQSVTIRPKKTRARGTANEASERMAGGAT